ncbi:MAG TPA: serine hydrolase [Streptosporangiaceae bacterium]
MATVLTATTTATTAAATAAAAAPASTSAPACAGPVSQKALEAKIAHAIDVALRSRFTSADPSYNPFDDVTVAVHDYRTGIHCWYHSSQQNYSASAVKATILAALLLKAQDEHRGLTSWEKNEAWLMITQSDNGAASALWAHVGLTALQHFLDQAKMKQTVLNTWGAWGLTEITGHDQSLLLQLLMSSNQVLTSASRDYELYLMNHVISSQTWGVRAGAPKYYSWHIKNGWAPLPNLSTSPWVINSIGCFLHKSSGYTIVVLTHDNPSELYGIATVESVAWVVNRDLVPGATSVWPRSSASVADQVPDETLPARPAGG